MASDPYTEWLEKHVTYIRWHIFTRDQLLADWPELCNLAGEIDADFSAEMTKYIPVGAIPPKGNSVQSQGGIAVIAPEITRFTKRQRKIFRTIAGEMWGVEQTLYPVKHEVAYQAFLNHREKGLTRLARTLWAYGGAIVITANWGSSYWVYPLINDIEALKAMPYDEYLKTAHWKIRRELALIFAGRRCQLCNSSGDLHVHHRTYERLGEEDPRDLTVLCSSCHSIFHANSALVYD